MFIAARHLLTFAQADLYELACIFWLSCLILSALSCIVLSCLVLSCLAYLVLSCLAHVISRRSTQEPQCFAKLAAHRVLHTHVHDNVCISVDTKQNETHCSILSMAWVVMPLLRQSIYFWWRPGAWPRCLFVVVCLSSVVCCLLFVVCCLLFRACCVPSVARCLSHPVV